MIAPVSFSGPALSTFGHADVDAAYQEVAAYAAANAVNPRVINTPRTQVTAKELAGAKSLMTANAAHAWDRFAAAPETPESFTNLAGVTLYGMNGNGRTTRTDVPQPAVRVHSGKASIDANGRLAMTFEVDQTVRIVAPGNKYEKYDAGRSVTYWLVKGKSKDKPWLIDGWQVNFRSNEMTPDVK